MHAKDIHHTADAYAVLAPRQRKSTLTSPLSFDTFQIHLMIPKPNTKKTTTTMNVSSVLKRLISVAPFSSAPQVFLGSATSIEIIKGLTLLDKVVQAPSTTTVTGVVAADANERRELAPFCSPLFISGVCDDYATCPGQMVQCQQACTGSCMCRQDSIGCFGAFGEPIKCSSQISCQPIGGGEGGDGEGAGTSASPCFDDHATIWQSSELEKAVSEATTQDCIEGLDEASSQYFVSCPPSLPSFESVCVSLGGFPQYYSFNHECGGMTVVYQNVPDCSSPSCSVKELSKISQNIETNIISTTESQLGTMCTDLPEPSSGPAAFDRPTTSSDFGSGSVGNNQSPLSAPGAGTTGQTPSSGLSPDNSSTIQSSPATAQTNKMQLTTALAFTVVSTTIYFI